MSLKFQIFMREKDVSRSLKKIIKVNNVFSTNVSLFTTINAYSYNTVEALVFLVGNFLSSKTNR